MRRFIFDIESEGVDFKNPDWVHDGTPKVITVIAIIDRDTKEKFVFRHDRPGEIDMGLTLLAEADWLGGHLITGFDIPYIQAATKFHGLKMWKPKPGCIIRDSKVESEMWYPANDLRSKDFNAERKYNGKWIDRKLFGKHSLQAWGQRIGRHEKDNFKERVEAAGLDPWAADLPEPYATERADYCLRDVEVNMDLFEYLEAKFPYDKAAEAVRIENRVARILTRQTQWGVTFNTANAYRLHRELVETKDHLSAKLKEVFEPFYLRDGHQQFPKKTMKRWVACYHGNQERLHADEVTTGYYEYRTKGEPFVKVKRVEFNPGSRMHIANRLMALYGWKPSELTDSGDPKVDETVLSALSYPPCKLLMQYLLVEKRLGQLAEGNQAWLRHDRDGHIHGKVNQNGTRTTRASHVNPNLGQVPKVKKNKDKTYKVGLAGGWGTECRALFGPRDGRMQVGVDLSGIELRALGHYMAKYDGGKYADLVINGDVHEATRKVIEFNSRDVTKTAEYAYLYGAGDYKLGLITYDDMTETQRKELGNATRGKLTQLGKATRAKLMKGLSGMDKLVKACHAASKRGWMRALDGRQIAAGSKHASLNTLLQHLGGQVAKVWMVELDDRLMDAGLIDRDSWIAQDTDKAIQMLWVHDEVQMDCTPRAATTAAQLAVEAAVATGERLKLRVRVDAEAKIGSSWKECH